MVGKLNFWGQRELPMTPSELAARTPIMATAKKSPKFVDVNKRTVYVATSRDVQPTVEFIEVEKGQYDQAIWQINIAESAQQQLTHMLGKSAVREDPQKTRSLVNAETDFTGFRPEWVDCFQVPRILPRTSRERLRRFNNRLVDPFYVFGSDDRRVYQDASYPWRCIGKLYNSDGFQGTAALVWNNIIVTAGHMVPWNRPNWWMRFVPDYFDGGSLVGQGIESYVSDVKGYDAGQVAGYDWAICKLYNPLGASLGYLGFNGYSSDWQGQNVWNVAGYPGDVAGGERPSWQGGVSIHDDDGDSNGGQELESVVADASEGDSGGPIWGVWNGDSRLIGVVSGGESEYILLQGHQDNNIFSSGSGLGDLIAWGRSNW